MSDRFRVAEASGLLVFLTAHLQGWSRNKVKQRLQTGCVTVNDEIVTGHGHPLEVGDEVRVLPKPKNLRRGVLRIEVLHSGDGLVAINKPAGLLSVGAKEGEPHALALVRAQLSRPGRLMVLWPVHRLDRDTSGVMLFASSREVRDGIVRRWSEAEKTYLGVIEGRVSPGRGTIDRPLRMDAKGFRAIVGPHPDAKRSITHFETKRQAPGRTLLELRIETGRQHQIRAHLASIGHPIVGDERYGTRGRRMGLHALRLAIPAPQQGARLTLEAPPPKAFLELMP